MFIFYIDASANRQLFVLSALRLTSERWREAFDQIKGFRRNLKNRYGVYVKKELHATDLVAWRGKYGSKPIGKYLRSQIFREVLKFTTTLPDAEILNVCITVPHCPVDPYLRAFERMLNRIQANLIDNQTQRIVFLDEGKEGMIRKVARQMAVFNWIPSKFGSWENGELRRNIKTSRVIEDPIFKSSESSYFLQLVDAVAFSLLKREVLPTPLVAKYGINPMFNFLRPVLCLKVSPVDPDGIERG